MKYSFAKSVWIFSALLIGVSLFEFSGVEIFSPSAQATSTGAFSDVNSSHKYAKSIQFLKDNNVVTGYADGTYRPDKPLIRAEFTKIIVLGTRQDVEPATIAPFPDVPLGKWYTDFIAFCARLEYVKGYPDGTFKPNQEINKVEGLCCTNKLYGNRSMSKMRRNNNLFQNEKEILT
ncbi:S-layer homology domain-containing protein [Candidatus Peregrinibacteria bacterium]|nr:S-layer homology domain-containing protein [Candidatus Peregrinibacteria bacterium]